MTARIRGGRLYDAVDRLHELAELLERRIDGDRDAFGATEAFDLVRTAVTVADSLAAIDALTRSRVVIPLNTHRTPRTEETR